MAATAVQDKLNLLCAESESDSPPLTLEHFGELVDTALDVVVRNLQWAAELVISLKQVAVDQTRSQRRLFVLRDLFDEILLTLHPTIKHTPFKVAVEIPEGLSLDSFPGSPGGKHPAFRRTCR